MSRLSSRTSLRHAGRISVPVLFPILLSVFLFILVLFNALTVSASTCNLYSSGAAVPTNYGVPWNPITTAQELLLDSYCNTDSSVKHTVGSNAANQYIHNKGYFYSTAWNQFTLSGTLAEGLQAWLMGQGTYTNPSPPATDYFWVGYVCHWQSSTSSWKCGCRDSACTTNHWQLQGVKRESVGGTPRIPELPFDIPSRAALAASPKQVLAYYHLFPTYWRNNADAYADWLIPTSNNNQFYSVGGKWRDRPFPVDNSNLTNAKRVAYMYQDIALAAAIGIDAFVINVNYTPSDFRWNEQLLPIYDAADQFNAENTPGFKVAIDLSAFQIAVKSGSDALPETWADHLAPFMDRISYYTYKGKPVVRVYNFTDLSPSWYQAFASRLKNAYGKDIYIFPSYQGSQPTEMDPYASMMPGLMPFLHVWSSVGYSTTPEDIFSNFRSWASARGVKFMGSVKHNVHRGDELKTQESKGFTLLQNMWESSLYHGDEIMLIVSWSDHLENHHIRPSTGYQYVPYDLSAYYITRFKTGSPPPIVRDVLYYAHRMHLTTEPRNTAYQPSPFAFQLAGSNPPVNDVVALSFLKSPADVRIVSGGQTYDFTNVPAGVSVRTAPLKANDQPKFSVIRNGTAVIPQFSSAFRSRSPILWQDMQYRMGSSSRPPVAAVQNNLPEDRL